jgi:hypothetical protein
MTERQTSQQHRANSVARIDSAILARQNDLPPSERAAGLELSSGQSRIPIFTPFTAAQARVGPTTPTHVAVVAKRGITVNQRLSLCSVRRELQETGDGI